MNMLHRNTNKYYNNVINGCIEDCVSLGFSSIEEIKKYEPEQYKDLYLSESRLNHDDDNFEGLGVFLSDIRFNKIDAITAIEDIVSSYIDQTSHVIDDCLQQKLDDELSLNNEENNLNFRSDLLC